MPTADDMSDQQVAGDRIEVTLGLGAAMFAVISVMQLTFDPAPMVWLPSVVAASTAAVLAAGAVVIRGRWGATVRRHGDLWAAGIATVIGINPYVYMLATEETYPAIGAVLVIVAIAALIPSPRWALLLVLTMNVAWLVIAGLHPPPVPYPTLMLQIAKADAVAVIIAWTWRRTRLRLAEANQLLHEHATGDVLTGLPNRRWFEKVVAAGPGTYQAVAYVDLDGLKRVNDGSGHAAGDRYIKGCARLLRDRLDPADRLARVGGDEFVVLKASSGDLHTWSENLVSLQLDMDAQGFPISIGIAAIDEQGSFDIALKGADSEMLKNKVRRAATRLAAPADDQASGTNR